MVCHEGDGPCVTVELCECTFQSWRGGEKERGKYHKKKYMRYAEENKVLKLKYGESKGLIESIVSTIYCEVESPEDYIKNLLKEPRRRNAVCECTVCLHLVCQSGRCV